MKLRFVVYEEEYPKGIYPFSLAKPSSHLIYKYKPLIAWIKEILGEPEGFLAPEALAKAYDLKKPKRDYDLVINSRVFPEKLTEASDLLKDGESLWEEGILVAAKGSLEGSYKKTVEGFLIKGPWQLLDSLKEPPFKKTEVLGEVGKLVDINDSNGPVIIEKGATVDSLTVIYGPAYVSTGSVISYAKVSSSYIGKNCRIGGEVERSVIEDYANKVHYGFVGDSYVGSHSNLGAGTTVSNLKNTYGTVRVFDGEKRVDTRKVKVGAFIGDFVRTAINTSIMSGKTVGPFSHVMGTVKEDVPPFTFYDRPMDVDKLIQQLERYMSRKGLTLSEEYKGLIKESYKLIYGSRL